MPKEINRAGTLTLPAAPLAAGFSFHVQPLGNHVFQRQPVGLGPGGSLPEEMAMVRVL